VHVVEGPARADRKLVDTVDLEATVEVPAERSIGPAIVEGEQEQSEETQLVDVPRPITVLAFAAGDNLLIEARGSRRVPTRTLSVNLRTGQRALIGDENGEDRLLHDWTGRARVRATPRVQVESPPPPGGHGMPIPPAPPIVIPQRFEYRSAGAIGGWRPLDALVGRASGLHFQHDDGDEYRPRSFPLAFGADPQVLYFASNVRRDTYGIYDLDLATGKRGPLAIEVAHADLVDPSDAFSPAALVFDRRHQLMGVRVPGPTPTTRWLDPVLARLQAGVDARFERREARIIGWSESKSRLLLWVSGATDAGRYFIYEPGTPPAITELLRRGLAGAGDAVSAVIPLACRSTDGRMLYGTLTLPGSARVTPPPLVVWFRDAPGLAARAPSFNRMTTALAMQGFMVVDVAYRGTAGFGAAHRDALRNGFDKVPFEDIHTVLTWLAANHPYDRRRVAAVGEGFGGYLALRALERFPGEFRCAVGINAPSDLRRWVEDAERIPGPNGTSRFSPIPSLTLARRRAFFGDRGPSLTPISLFDEARLPTGAVLIVQDAGRPDLPLEQGTRWRDWLSAHGREPEYVVLKGGIDGDGSSAAQRLLRVAGFLNANLFSYRVELGKEQEVK
jgi:dienelactone hydrolase